MRPLIILLCLLSVTVTALAQRDFDEESSWSLKDRGYLGLGLGGLGFGTDNYYGRYFTIGVSGQAGYFLTKNLSTGIGLEYQYTSYSDLQIKNNLYVAYPFLRYNIKDFFIQADYDSYSLNVNLTADKQRRVYERFFIGLGYSSPMGNRGRVNFLVSYDFLYPNGNVFTSPLSTRFYFTF